MFEAKFKLKHKGCWTGGLTKFKSKFITHNAISLNEGFVQDITEVFLENTNEATQIKKYFKNNKLIQKYEILEETETKLVIQLFTNTSNIKSIANIVLKNKCFLSKKVPLIDSYEIWTIAAPKKTAIRHALDEVKSLGTFKLLYIKKSTFDGFNLSPNQEKVINLAIELGYYNWPKHISIQELAKRLKLSKPTVAEHLRKAEIKIITKEFNK